MGQQIKKVCQHQPGELWTDGCCTDNPPVDNSSIKSHAIASTVERSPKIQTEVQHLLEATAV
ncbi:MAG: hypothetical protein RMX68_009485 [Aulosira sp. ZfuVER01]|nr:hypothetical protein [Aulosira sp. ZfuVER01]MDZ7996449.1 hypothetical protein [Aulosira sp. DedVER01a]MDZ8050343.1 hypothetical protein [Aulosira sp. ZfuCHP01]